MGNGFWDKKYNEIEKEAPKNEKERNALRLLGEGCGTYYAQQKSGLSDEEWRKLIDRTRAAELEKLCVPLPKKEQEEIMLSRLEKEKH